MEVVVKRPCSIIYNLIDGTVFCYEGKYFIKTDNYDSVTKRCTCVNISTGALYELSETLVVPYYDVKVVIE